MLALDVNVLASKLQQQSLKEGETTPSNIKLIQQSDSGYKLSESTQARLGAVGQGKNVWTVTVNNRVDELGTQTSEDQELNAGFKHLTCSDEDGAHCQDGSDGSKERPKKRHCRSMTVPQETEISIPPTKSTWKPQGSRLWKPVAIGATGAKFDMRSVHWLDTCPTGRRFEFNAVQNARQCERGNLTPDNVLTPPESPVSRPNSVYSDGAISPFSSDAAYHSSFYHHHHHPHPADFPIRSLSFEDQISSPAMGGMVFHSGSVNSVPGITSSMPSSPHHRSRVPRCRSQPSFYDRKSGRRRRRDSRPMLNFNKMTETAYGHPMPEHLAGPHEQAPGSRFHDALETVMRLLPIASSPRDCDSNFGNREMTPLSPARDTDSTSCESVLADSDTGSISTKPVKLLGEDDDEMDMEVFQLTEELDLEQIENH